LDKLNRIAVLLAGDFRFWPRAAEYIFAFAERQAITVDYYFATWPNTQDFWLTQDKKARKQRPVTEYDITCEFAKHNKNLINFQLVKNFNNKYYPTFYYQTYLAKLVNLMKRRYELDNDFVYDQVFEMRPDLYIYDEINTPVILTDFEWLGEISYTQNNCANYQWPTAADLYYQANSFGNDVLAERYYYRKSIEASKFSNRSEFKHCHDTLHNHWILFDYSYARRLQSISIRQHQPIHLPIRSNFPQDDLRNYNWAELCEYAEQYWRLVISC
jgi:hypothetical protein